MGALGLQLSYMQTGSRRSCTRRDQLERQADATRTVREDPGKTYGTHQTRGTSTKKITLTDRSSGSRVSGSEVRSDGRRYPVLKATTPSHSRRANLFMCRLFLRAVISRSTFGRTMASVAAAPDYSGGSAVDSHHTSLLIPRGGNLQSCTYSLVTRGILTSFKAIASLFFACRVGCLAAGCHSACGVCCLRRRNILPIRK